MLILGFSNIFADAFAMGMGEFLSSKAHNEYVLKERQREKWCVILVLRYIRSVADRKLRGLHKDRVF